MVEDHGCVAQSTVLKRERREESQFVLACGGIADGFCESPGDLCKPKLPAPPPGVKGKWTYCIRQFAPDATCPQEYLHPHIFARSVDDGRDCAPCTCGPTEGAKCSSFVETFTDDQCTEPVASFTATASATMCVDIPAGWIVKSERASSPVYQPGTCQPAGGEVRGPFVPHDEAVLCCMD
jgi:hypothetical protein